MTVGRSSTLVSSAIILILLFIVSPPVQGIHNGDDADIRDYPWMAAILIPNASNDGWVQECGGVLIAPSWVLTAAHCVTVPWTTHKTNVEDLRVAVGTEQNEDGSWPLRDLYEVAEIERYQDPWDKLHITTDIALLKLARTVLDINPIKFELSCFDIGVEFRVLGWGNTNEEFRPNTDNWPDRLQQIDVEYEPSENCWNTRPRTQGEQLVRLTLGLEYYEKGRVMKTIMHSSVMKKLMQYVNPVLMCMKTNLSSPGGSPGGIRLGDSGGPVLYRYSDDGEWGLVGLVQGNPQGNNDPNYGGALLVVYYLEWIEETTSIPLV